MLLKSIVLFLLGVAFGACTAWWRYAVVVKRLHARLSSLPFRTARRPIPERATMRVKIGVMPFDERPTLVHEGIPDNIVPCGPPEPAVRGTIEVVTRDEA